MKKYRIVNRTRGSVLGVSVERADTSETRRKGLLGRTGLGKGEGLWIVPTEGIHTFFMKFAIDVLFLSQGLEVVRVMENLKPWRISPWVFRAHSVLELFGGIINGSVRKGDFLEFR